MYYLNAKTFKEELRQVYVLGVVICVFGGADREVGEANVCRQSTWGVFKVIRVNVGLLRSACPHL